MGEAKQTTRTGVLVGTPAEADIISFSFGYYPGYTSTEGKLFVYLVCLLCKVI